MNVKLIAIAAAGVLGTIGGSVISGNVSYNNALETSAERTEVAVSAARQDGFEAGQSALLVSQADFRTNPTFDADDWDSDGNRIWMENQIETNMVFRATGADASVSGAACTASSLTNRWHCVYRETGEFIATRMDVEVNPRTLTWSSY